jgi:hypothetical protein
MEREDPTVLDAIRMAYKRETNEDLDLSVGVEIERLAEKEFRVTLSNVDLNRSELGRRVVSQGVLALAGLNQTLNCMATLQSVTGLQHTESELFRKKMKSMADRGLGDVTENQFDRVIHLGGLPSFEELPPETGINVKQLQAIRDSDDCIRMREWIRNADEKTDLEISNEFQDLHGRIANITNSKTGKAMRFITAALAGNVPIVGVGLGPAVSAADQFLVDKVIGRPGPAMFLSHNYASLFTVGGSIN